VPGGQKRKSDFQTEEEWKAYKAEREAKEHARFAQQAAIEQEEHARRYEEWHADRTAVAVEFLASWDALYAATIATTNPDLVRLANRLHRATQSVFAHLSGEMMADDWYDAIPDSYDPLEHLPEVFESALLGPTSHDQAPTETDAAGPADSPASVVE